MHNQSVLYCFSLSMACSIGFMSILYVIGTLKCLHIRNISKNTSEASKDHWNIDNLNKPLSFQTHERHNNSTVMMFVKTKTHITLSMSIYFSALPQIIRFCCCVCCYMNVVYSRFISTVIMTYMIRQ